jgi:hypothetical protein
MNVRLFKNQEQYTTWYNSNCDKCIVKKCVLRLEVIRASVLDDVEVGVAYKIGCKHIKGSSSVQINKTCNKFKDES